MEVLDDILYWEHHELASSRRQEGVDQIIFDAQGGQELDRFKSEKAAGSLWLPQGAAYVLARYWTGSGYPEHTLFALPKGGEGELEEVAFFDRNTRPRDLAGLPKGIRRFLSKDLF